MSQAFFHGRARSLQGPFDGGFTGVEHLGYLGGAKCQRIVEHERCILAGRQVLKRGDKRESNELSGVVASVRPRTRVRESFEQHVRVGVKPDRFGHAGGLGWLDH